MVLLALCIQFMFLFTHVVLVEIEALDYLVQE